MSRRHTLCAAAVHCPGPARGRAIRHRTPPEFPSLRNQAFSCVLTTGEGFAEPGGVLFVERGEDGGPVVQGVVVAGAIVDRGEGGLEVELYVRIGFIERNRDIRKRLAGGA